MEDPAASKHKPRSRNTDETRAERKRIQDRLAQRATRERTKNRIAYLEQRLSSLESGNKQSEIASLTRIIDDLRLDNERLRNALVKIRTTIDQAVHMTEDQSSNRVDVDCPQVASSEAGSTNPHERSSAAQAPSGRNNSVSVESDITEIIDGGHLDADGHNIGSGIVPEPDSPVNNMAGLEDLFEFSPTSLLEAFELGPTAWNTTSPSPFDYHFPTADIWTRIAPDVDKWHVSNGAFIGCLDSITKRTATTTTLDLHVPFKAAIWGWDVVGPEAQHPVWNALRQVDQRVFGTWTSKAQRIALMYVCQTLIQYRENPTKENLNRVPVFLRPRPSQEKIQHPAVIDFLIWPALRDRLVFEHKKYTSTGAFSAAYVDYFNFYWPYSDRDIFSFNPETSRYEVSKMFLEHLYDFKNWTMKPEFFKIFPEMQHDIAVFEEPLPFP